MENRSVFIVFRVAGSIDRRTFCFSPFALIRPSLRSIIPSPRVATLPSRFPRWPLRCSSHPSGNPIRRLLYSYLKSWREAKVVVPRSFFPLFRLASPPPSFHLVHPQCGTRSLSSLVFSQGGRSKKLRKKRKIGGRGFGWWGSSRLFLGVCLPSQLAAESKGCKGIRYNAVFRYLVLSAEKHIGVFIKSLIQNNDVIYHINVTNIKEI